MDTLEKQQLLNRAKNFFKENIFQKHLNNTCKLSSLSEFNVNPFLIKYLSNFLTGDSSPESIAKALIYPRVLGTSVSTTFGTQLQYFCSSVLSGYASTTSGIDLEFIDSIDGRKKYCQVKAGPNTINKDDVKTITDHFQAVKNLARTNRQMQLSIDDLIVGIFYGEPEVLSTHYKNINKEHPVYVGKEFWHRLTGDKDFYFDLIKSVGEAAEEVDGQDALDRVIHRLAEAISEAISEEMGNHD